MAETVSSGKARHASDVMGDWGPVQQRIVIVLTIGYLVAPFNNWGILFWTAKYDFFCNVRDPINNETILSLKNQCSYNASNGLVHQCHSFTYDDRAFRRTLVSDFNLICDRRHYVSLSQSVHQLGYMMSGNVIGWLSDRFGRKSAVRSSILLEIIAGFGQAFSPSIHFFLAARLLVGFSAYGRFLSSYVLIAEWCSPALRPQVLMAFELGYAVAKLALPLCFFLYSDYFVMQVVVSLVEAVILMVIVFTVWESPHWLLTHGRHKEAEQVMRRVAEANGTLDSQTVDQKIREVIDHSNNDLVSETKAAVVSEGLLDVWRVPHLLKVSLIMYYTWLVSAFVGYGSSFNISSLGGSLYVSVTVSSVSSVVTSILLVFLVDVFARKQVISCCLTLITVTLIALTFASFHEDWYYVRLVLFFLFNASRSANLKFNYVYTTEVFPTTMRQTSVGTCSLFSRIGSVIAPFVTMLSDGTHVSVVFAIFAALTAVNAIIFAFAPETENSHLTDTVRQEKREKQLHP